MEWLTDEVLFYGGLVTAGVSLIMLILSVLIGRIRKLRLNMKLDAEYGPEEKGSGSRKKRKRGNLEKIQRM